MTYDWFVSCPRGLEYLLEEELKSLGLHVTRVSPQGVYGEANLATAYHICIWSRLANRVQLILFSGQAHNEQTIYKLCSEFAWQTVFTADKTFAIEFHGSSDQIRNTMYGAQLIKDAVVDYFNKLQHQRPSIDKHKPQILLHAFLKKDNLTVSFDLTGYSMHQRGYRSSAGRAPLKENVAAAMLMRAKWPTLAEKGYDLLDPFCGSGTLVIEAAMMAAHIAPGLLRDDQSLHHWVGHQPSLWEKIRLQALSAVRPTTISLKGSDTDQKIITTAQENAERAGVTKLISFHHHAFEQARANNAKGLLIFNPPYGERLGDTTTLISLYQQMGQVMHDHFNGWEAAFITSNPMLAKATGLRSSKQYTIFNGAIECKMYCVSLEENKLRDFSKSPHSEQATMLANRLKKNWTHLKKWAQRNHITCFRIYDADLPEYAYAIDWYNGYVVLQEYKAPANIPAHKTQKRTLDVMQVVPEVLGVAPDHLVVKERSPQKGKHQYQKLNKTQHAMTVKEGKATFKVNLYDYLDTGLFLDHRPLRLIFAELKKGLRFLNCFCYTGTASVHAALAGAITTNVDMSNTYLDWAKENFKLNHLDVSRHQFVQFDCIEWLKKTQDKYDVIFLDPPSFSNSKRMSSTLDIQRDHVDLILSAMHLLSSGGKLYFSTNLKRFKLAELLFEKFNIDDITEQTIDEDFKRSSGIHKCYLIKPL
jgi:23S rRNA (guanine2445-N2)-methyltransferase / 23S rRNA (guanine2069-N7)-methyltransferase